MFLVTNFLIKLSTFLKYYFSLFLINSFLSLLSLTLAHDAVLLLLVADTSKVFHLGCTSEIPKIPC
jgi:hypothetical protein